MSHRSKSILLWVLSFFLMAGLAVYQRATGPTYPERVKTVFEGTEVRAKLITSSDSEGDALVKISAPNAAIGGTYTFKRYKSHDEWQSADLVREGDYLIAALPHQDPAGKVMYTITLSGTGSELPLNEAPIVLRFKGKVPAYYLVPHIILMFLAMVFSTRAGLGALFKMGNYFPITLYTSALLFAGGLFLGPVVQYYAFGEFWTGWPWGHDLTDNKTAVAMIFWIIALFRTRKDPDQRGWVIAAAAVLLAVYLIPHSVLGSEIDYTAVQE